MGFCVLAAVVVVVVAALPLDFDFLLFRCFFFAFGMWIHLSLYDIDLAKKTQLICLC